MGNGITLGLTNGTSYGGLGTKTFASNNFLEAYADKYGAAVSSSNASSGFSTGGLGVTTDPTKSGIVLETDEMAKTFIAY